MFAERVIWIDLLEFAPDATSLVDFTEMTESGSERGTRKIRLGHEENALPQECCCCFVLTSKQICHAEEVEILVIRSRIQTHGAIAIWPAPQDHQQAARLLSGHAHRGCSRCRADRARQSRGR